MDAAQNTGSNQASELEVLWPGIVDSLPPNQRVWLASSKPLMLAESTAVVAVPNEFTRNQLEGRLRTRIEDTLSERLGKPVRLAVSVDPTLERRRVARPAGPHATPAWSAVPGPPPARGTRSGRLRRIDRRASLDDPPSTPSAARHDVRPDAAPTSADKST